MPITPPIQTDIIEGKIEKIAFGGEGILRYRGFVVFVPFTAPGDMVSCQITKFKKSFAKAKLLSIQTPSPYRVKPLCPYFGTCGGCQLQHLNASEQSHYKQEAVVDALKRIGHLTFPAPAFIPATLKWAYRRHVTLHLKPYSSHFQAGYIACDNESLVVIDTCPIFNEEQDLVVSQLQKIVGSIPNPDETTGKVNVLKNHRGRYILSFYFESNLTVDERFFKHILQQYPTFIGIFYNSPSKQFSLGDCYSEQSMEGLTVRFTPQAFIQNHPEQSANIYRQVCRLTQQPLKRKILDLYCGFGMTSLLLAKQGHQVIGIESNPEAILFAQQNSQLNRLSQARFIRGDVERLLPKLTKEFKPDLILMNPPRTGLTKEVVQTLLRAKSQEIIYISCMPATLARDLADLCHFYSIQAGEIYDMFPQTSHVETLVHLKLNE